jgi:dTMP kinase
MEKGVFIVIEGTDGSGKTVQTKKLVENLKTDGKDVETIEFPQYGSKSAGLVEEYLNGKYGSAEDVGPYRASIFFACDRYDASFKVKKWLEQGKIVIANRYTSANMGHQAGKIKDKEERDKYLEWLENLEFNIFQIPKPDATILLFMPPEIGQQLVDKKGHRDYVNGNKRDIHEADLDHLKNAAEAYKYVAEKYNWLVIDCAPNNELREIEDISKEVFEKVKNIEVTKN